MSLSTSKISCGPMGSNGANITESCRVIKSFAKPIQHIKSNSVCQMFKCRRLSYGRTEKLAFFSDGLSSVYGKKYAYTVARENSFLCQSRGTHNTEAKECVRSSDDYSDVSRTQVGDDDANSLSGYPSGHSIQGLTNIRKLVYNDVKYVNERARNDMFMLSRGIMKLNDRACQDVAVLGSEFLKLDARAREDTEKIDHGVKKRAEHLHEIATILQDKAQSKLKSAADKHWNNGALEADLRRADYLSKRRAMEDAFMALEFVKNIYDMMVTKTYNLPLLRKEGSLSTNDMMNIMLEKNGKTLDFLPAGLSTDRISAIQEAYWSMASALSEADGIDYTDPEELELVVATLIDLDAMDGKSSVSLLAECSSSPDVSTRIQPDSELAGAWLGALKEDHLHWTTLKKLEASLEHIQKAQTEDFCYVTRDLILSANVLANFFFENNAVEECTYGIYTLLNTWPPQVEMAFMAKIPDICMLVN